MLVFSFIRWILGFSVAILLAWFCILNRTLITIQWSPVQEAVETPIYALVLGCTIFGFLLGGSVVWINSSPLRKTRRTQKKKIKTLEQELDAVNENLPPVTTADKIHTALITKK